MYDFSTASANVATGLAHSLVKPLDVATAQSSLAPAPSPQRRTLRDELYEGDFRARDRAESYKLLDEAASIGRAEPSDA
jgi:hypothetical protein